MQHLDSMRKIEAWLALVSDHANYCFDVDKMDEKSFQSLTSVDTKLQWSIQDKHDGVYCNVFVVDDAETKRREVKAFSRDGKPLSNLQMIEAAFQHPVPCGVYIHEATIENGSFEDASRFFNPNVKNQLDLKAGQRVKLWAFDYVRLDEFFSGRAKRSYKNRYAGLQSIYDEYYMYNHNIEYVKQYVVIGFAWALNAANASLNLDLTLEGKIVRDVEGVWIRGARNYFTFKVVRYTYYKLRVVAIQVGKGKHAKAVGALMLAWPTKGIKGNPLIRVPVDGKISYETRREWYVRHSQNAYLENRVVRVRAKGLTNKGNMRQPKLLQLLPTGTESDF